MKARIESEAITESRSPPGRHEALKSAGPGRGDGRAPSRME